MAWPQVCHATTSVVVPRVNQASKLEDFEGMTPKGAAVQLQHVTSFIQNHPFDGKQPTERSEAYLGYDQTNLYIVLLCWDHEHGVRSSLTRREPPTTNHDNRPFDSDDYVEITLDTFQDQVYLRCES